MDTKPQSQLWHEADSLPRTQSLGPAGLCVNAPAKLNLNLLVGPLRDDGFHPLDSFVTKITFYDRIELRLRNDGQINLTCAGIDCGSADDNLAIRAAQALAEGRGVDGVDISLTKFIPPGGGLGGGSSDAAGVLAGLNQLWCLDLSVGQLAEIAVGLGSDVPLFLAGPASRMTGRGEILQPVDVYPFWTILILPRIACPTGPVYRAFDAAPIQVAKQLDANKLTQPPSTWRDRLVNHLERPAMEISPELADIRDEISTATGLPVNMSGSGSTLFMLCDNQAEVQDVYGKVPEEFKKLCRAACLNEW